MNRDIGCEVLYSQYEEKRDGRQTRGESQLVFGLSFGPQIYQQLKGTMEVIYGLGD